MWFSKRCRQKKRNTPALLRLYSQPSRSLALLPNTTTI